MSAVKHSSTPPASPRPLKQLCEAASKWLLKNGMDITYVAGDGVAAKLVQTGRCYAFIVCGVPEERIAVLAETPLRV